MLRGRRERGSSSSGGAPTSSLLIPPNPAIADPGSSPTSRGGILLNPLGSDGSPTTSLPSNHPSTGSVASISNRSSSLSSNTSRNAGNGVARGYFATRGGRRSTSLSGSSHYSSSSSGQRSPGSNSNEDALSVSSSASPRLKFAPLPESGRIKRSNSITLGVAARAQMLQGSGMGGGGGGRPAPQAPHWQQQVYNPGPSAPMWYNGGPMPDNVKTLKDIKPGIKKAWGAIRRRRSSSNASSASTSSLATNESGSEGGNGIKSGGAGSEADISSINEEDEHDFVDTPPSTDGSGGKPIQQGQGPHGVTLGKEGVLVEEPPGSEAYSEGGQPPRRQNSDAYSISTLDSEAISDTSDMTTDSDNLDGEEGGIPSRQGLSESPSYTPGMGPHGHYYPHHLHSHEAGGTRSGEATPRKCHSPTTSSPGSLSRTQSKRQEDHQPHNHYHNQQHWTPHITEQGVVVGGNGSAPGSGVNTPRRRMSLGDITANGNGSRKGSSAVFGFDEAQLKNRLGAMDLNSRRRKHHADDDDEMDGVNEGELNNGEQDTRNQRNDEDEVPMPVDSKQVRGAALEIAV